MRVVGNCVQYRERHSNRKLIFGHIFRQHRLILSALVLGYTQSYLIDVRRVWIWVQPTTTNIIKEGGERGEPQQPVAPQIRANPFLLLTRMNPQWQWCSQSRTDESNTNSITLSDLYTLALITLWCSTAIISSVVELEHRIVFIFKIIMYQFLCWW